MDKQLYTKISLCIMLLVVFISGSPLYAQFGGGSGTAADPYLVQTAAHLNSIRNYRTSHFLQTANIDLNVAPYNQNAGWNPIGTPVAQFSGVYEGGGFSISGLYINRQNSFVGLFGYTMGAELSRIRIINANVTGTSFTGALVGCCTDSEVSKCLVSATIAGEDMTGGLAGRLDNCIVRSCQVTVNFVDGSGFIGGLSGYCIDSTIDLCVTNGTATGLTECAGIAGAVSLSTITNSYSKMNMVNVGSAAGIVIMFLDGAIRNTYYAGTMTNCSYKHGLVEICMDTPDSVVACYWNTQTSGTSQSEGGEGRTTLQMTYPYAANTYVGWDFSNTWVADSTATQNGGYPYLRSASLDGVVERPIFSHNTGYYNQPILVSISTQTSNSVIYYTLDGSEPSIESSIYTAPISISETTIIKAFAVRPGWINSFVSTASYYLGIFAGGSGTIADPYLISNAEQLYAVRYAPNACFRQTQNIDLNVAPYNSGLGWSPIGNGDEIGNARFTGTYDGDAWKITHLLINNSSNSTAYGLFGEVYDAELKNISLTDVNITGQNITGGLIGRSTNTIVSRCFVTGVIHGGSQVGGLVGFAGNSDIQDCYSRASVYGGHQVGGFLGLLGSQTEIIDCYSTGFVSCTGSNYGGFIGNTQNTGWSVHNSYWDINTSGQSSSVAGTGKTTDDMTYPYATDCYVGWTFNYSWRQDTDNSNNGYPYFYRRVGYPNVTSTEPISGEVVTVTIGCITYGARLYYTLDGSDPDENSLPYGGPFQVYVDEDSLVVVKVIGYREDFEPSEIASHTINFGSGSAVSDTDAPEIALQMTAYPNPVRDVLSLRLNLPQAEHTKLMIYNLRGQLIKVLQDSMLRAGEHSLSWDIRDANGAIVAPGIYFIRLETTGTSKTHKILVIE